MKLLIIISCIAISHGAIFTNGDKECSELKVDSLYHRRVLKSGLYKPYSLVMDYGTNMLYFSYIKNGDVFYQTAKVNLDTKEFAELDGIENGFSQAVDQKTHAVYIGTYKGIYKYDEISKKADIFGAEGTFIWNVFYKDVLYYVEFLSQSVYKLVDGVSTPFKDLEGAKVYYFVIDDENDIVYVNSTGLYSKNDGETVMYKKVSSKDDVRAIALDKDGKAHICLADGVYRINKSKGSLEKIVDVNDAFGVTFDGRNNMIYSTANELVHLRPKKNFKKKKAMLSELYKKCNEF